MSYTFQKILVPVDGSETSYEAVDYALALAKISGGVLEIVTVVDLGQLDIYEGLHMTDEQLKQWQSRIKQSVLDEAVARLPEDAPSHTATLLRGKVVKTLLGYIEDNDVDHVVLGRTGKGAVDRFMHGSVSRRMTERCTVPITIVG